MGKQAGKFIWNTDRESANIIKHGINFSVAAKAFMDAGRKIFIDSKHSAEEPRYFCIGKVDDKIITVRFTYRKGRIRIFGAGFWRRGKEYYEKG
jgi:uncharacterized protein